MYGVRGGWEWGWVGVGGSAVMCEISCSVFVILGLSLNWFKHILFERNGIRQV